jgi:hypothetical protein
MQILVDSLVTKRSLIEKINKKIDFWTTYQKEREDWAIEGTIRERDQWRKINPFLKKFNRMAALVRLRGETGPCHTYTPYQMMMQITEKSLRALEKMKKIVEQSVIMCQDIALEQKDIDLIYQEDINILCK